MGTTGDLRVSLRQPDSGSKGAIGPQRCLGCCETRELSTKIFQNGDPQREKGLFLLLAMVLRSPVAAYEASKPPRQVCKRENA